METINNCPVCNNSQFKSFLKCEDFTVSHEIFNIDSCDSCGFLFTNPRPTREEIIPYYKAEAYVSHTDSKKGLINTVYHLVRNFTLKEKLGIVHNHNSNKTLLDYGCGTGYFLNYANNSGYKCIGIEPDNEARELAINNSGLNVIEPNELNNIENNSLDIITLWHVLEHVHDLNPLINTFTQKLKADGILVIAVPNPDSHDAQHYKKHWAAFDLPRHLYHFTPTTITKLMEKHSLRLTKTYPMNFDSYYVSMLSEKYKGGNNLSAFLNGFKSNWKHQNENTDKCSSQIYIFNK